MIVKKPLVVLGIDTASSRCAVAAVSAGVLTASRMSDRPRAHAEVLMELVEACLDAVEHGLRRPDAVAVSGGPGSFTGLRVGFSVAKGLCSAGGGMLAVVPTFEAWALEGAARTGAGTGTVILTAVSAGRAEAHVASFRASENGVVPEHGPRIAQTGELPAVADGWGARLIVGDRRAELESWFGRAGGAGLLATAEDGLDIAGRVAMLGMNKIETGETSDPATAEPMYLRDFSTTLPDRGAR